MNPQLKFIIFPKRTIYEISIHGNKTLRNLFKKGHKAIRGLKKAHIEHLKTLNRVISLLKKFKAEFKVKKSIKKPDVENCDVLLTVGGDGTVLYASHHTDKTPIFPVNSSPLNSAGYLTSAQSTDIEEKLALLIEGKLGYTTFNRICASIDGKVVDDRILNDVLFSAPYPALTSRYFLKIGRKEEKQLSSGIWISTAAGSTAAIFSCGGKILPPESKKIQFLVREPIIRGSGKLKLLKGIINERGKITITNGWQKSFIFIDGAFGKFIVAPGAVVEIKSSKKPLKILGWRGRKNKNKLNY